MPSVVRSRYLIAYDITDDKMRTKLAKMLEDYGDRVQKSLFEADLTADDVRDILLKAAHCVEKSDSLRIYRACANCRKAIHTLGRPMPLSTPTLVIV